MLDHFLLEPEALLDAWAPEGWERSPLHRAFHPTSEQVAEERERFRRNLAALRQDGDAGEEARDDIYEDSEPSEKAQVRPIEAEQEVVELLGGVLWDVFSDNHTVLDAEGVAYDLGSFRGSAGFIAESLNRRYTHLRRRYDYMDFYMGTFGYSNRADLRPVYRWIFTRLGVAGCRWRYTFPRLYLLDIRGGTEEARENDSWTYDPSEAVRSEVEASRRKEERRSLAEELDRGYEEDVRDARDRPLPAAVVAYRDIFGTLPEGWPHPDS